MIGSAGNICDTQMTPACDAHLLPVQSGPVKESGHEHWSGAVQSPPFWQLGLHKAIQCEMTNNNNCTQNDKCYKAHTIVSLNHYSNYIPEIHACCKTRIIDVLLTCHSFGYEKWWQCRPAWWLYKLVQRLWTHVFRSECQCIHYICTHQSHDHKGHRWHSHTTGYIHCQTFHRDILWIENKTMTEWLMHFYVKLQLLYSCESYNKTVDAFRLASTVFIVLLYNNCININYE